MSYGSPTRHYGRLEAVHLDLPRAVAWVKEINQEKPPLEVLGPLSPGQPPAEAERRLPDSITIEDRVVTFEFEDGLKPGRYHILVHQSRFRLDGESETLDKSHGLMTDAGVFRGWELNIYPADEAPEIGDPADTPHWDDDGRISEPGTRPADFGNILGVYLDGNRVQVGQSELSGRSLTVRSEGPVEVELRVKQLMPNPTRLGYEEYVVQDEIAGGDPDDIHEYRFEAQGPLNGRNWAVYHGRVTEGRIPRNDLGQLAFGEAVIGPPGSYDGPIHVDDLSNIFADEETVAFDLPVGCRLEIWQHGPLGTESQRVWWGQTRLIPLFISADRFLMLETGTSSESRSAAEIADLRRTIWRASLEAARLWGCTWPNHVPETVEAYVLTRLAMGWPDENGVQGEVFARLGDQAYRGESDKALERRLKSLAQELKACNREADLFPEDSVYTEIARTASEAHPTYHPKFSQYEGPSQPYRRRRGGRDRADRLDPLHKRRPRPPYR